jgi:hypothetical protein
VLFSRSKDKRIGKYVSRKPLLRGWDMSESLDEKVEVMKREVDALQIAVTGQKKPWYRNVSTLIAVLALLFSFGTTYVSYRRTEAQDVQSTRQELRGLLQRLAALPKENLELAKRYKDDPGAVNFAGSLISQEITLLSRQAAELAKKLPKGTVSATEYYAIGVGFQTTYNFKSEKEFLDLSIENAKDFNDEIAALRTSANLEFIGGHPEAGRVEYQKALNIFAKYQGYDTYTINSTDIWTELSWASSEAGIGKGMLADQHVANAEAALANLLPSPGSQMLRSQILQEKTQIHGGAVPIPGVPPQTAIVPPQAQ